MYSSQERPDESTLTSLVDVGSSDCPDIPYTVDALCHQSANADDGVISGLREGSTQSLPDFSLTLADEPRSPSESVEIWNRLDIPYDDE